MLNKMERIAYKKMLKIGNKHKAIISYACSKLSTGTQKQRHTFLL